MITVSQNGDFASKLITIKNNSLYLNTNVSVTFTLPPGIAYHSITPVVGSLPPGTSYNSITNVLTLPNMSPNQEIKFNYIVTVTNIALGPFSLEALVSATIDSLIINNSLTWEITVESCSTCNPAAGAIDDENACLCGSVATNDTPCSYGTTRYVINYGSVVNGEVVGWDESTGTYSATFDDPTQTLSFQYSIWCDLGEDSYETSGPATVTINPIIADKSVFNHTISTVPYSSLSPDDIGVLSAQYPSLVLSEYCWRVLRNANGEATSGEPVDCAEEIDTRTFFICSEVDCTTPESPCPCPTDELPIDVPTQLPVGYSPEKGDTIVIYHPNAMSVWTFDGTLWNKWSCGCIYKISQDAGNSLTLGSDGAPYLNIESLTEITELQDKVVVDIEFTGTNTKTLTLTFDDGSTLTATFTDLQGGGGSTSVQVSDTCSINMSISGTGTVLDPFIITAYYNDGDPVYNYSSGTPGSIGNTLDVSTLFDMPCALGCTATYTLNGYPSDVYENVTLVGTTLTYDIKANAPSGTHDINIRRECAPTVL